MIDNLDIAVLTRVNELAERYGLRPYDFVATVGHDEDGGYQLTYETAPGGPLAEGQLVKMLEVLGDQVAETGTFVAEPKEIIKALDAALRRTRPRLPRNI